MMLIHLITKGLAQVLSAAYCTGQAPQGNPAGRPGQCRDRSAVLSSFKRSCRWRQHYD